MTRPIPIFLRWTIVLWNYLKRPIPLSRPITYVQALLLIVADMIWSGWPFTPIPPGVAIGILGVSAVIMAVRTDEMQQFRWEKAAWILVGFVLLSVEVHSIYEDRDQFQRERSESELLRQHQFAEILRDNQTKFAATLDGFRAVSKNEHTLYSKTVNQLTGGDSFCVAVVVNDYRSIGFHNAGDYALSNVVATIIDASGLQLRTTSAEDFFAHTIQHFEIGDLAKDTLRLESPFPLPPAGKTAENLVINFTARNGIWTQTMAIRLVKGKWVQATTVSRPVSGQNNVVMKTLLKSNDADFPKDSQGKLDWSVHQ